MNGSTKGERTMAQREYKQLSCRQAGADCDFLVRAETEAELMRIAIDHACRVHDHCEVTSEMKDKMLSATASIWCQEGDCSSAPKAFIHVPQWGRKF